MCITDIKQIISPAKAKAYAAVNSTMQETNWFIDKKLGKKNSMAKTGRTIAKKYST